MANSIDYVQRFSTVLDKKYAAESKTYALTQSNKGVTFINAQTIKIPTLTLEGFKYHRRAGANSFNTRNVRDTFVTRTLSHDRDAEFILDAMDVDETNAIVSIANIQNEFEEQHAIPEWDAYRLSTLYSEVVDRMEKEATELGTSVSDVLDWYDEQSALMDDAGVPEEGRILYCTPTYKKLLSKALTRQLTATDRASEDTIDRLGNTQIISVPTARMKSAYDFSSGFTPEVDALQMVMILIHPSCVVARDKYAYMKAFAPGSDSRTADAWIYQIRKYGGLFLMDNKIDGVAIAVKAEG